MIEQILESFGQIIINNYELGLLIAFIAGIITVFTPCSLSSAPILISYVSASGTTKKKAFLYSLFIAIGQIISFVTLGIIAGSLNILMGMGGLGGLWNVLLAGLMIVMSLEIFGFTNFIGKANTCKINPSQKVTKKGILGAFGVGALGVMFSTPCSTPILVAMLGYVSLTGSGVIAGGMMLLSYAIGFSLLYIVAGFSIGVVKQLNNEKIIKVATFIKYIFGVLIFVLGCYLLYVGLF